MGSIGVNPSWAVFCQHSLTHCKHIKVSVDTSLDMVYSSRKTSRWKTRRRGLGVEPSLMPSGVAATIASSFFSAFTRWQLGQSQDLILTSNNPGRVWDARYRSAVVGFFYPINTLTLCGCSGFRSCFGRGDSDGVGWELCNRCFSGGL